MIEDSTIHTYRCTLRHARPGGLGHFVVDSTELHAVTTMADFHRIEALPVGGTLTDSDNDQWERLS